MLIDHVNFDRVPECVCVTYVVFFFRLQCFYFYAAVAVRVHELYSCVLCIVYSVRVLIVYMVCVLCVFFVCLVFWECDECGRWNSCAKPSFSLVCFISKKKSKIGTQTTKLPIWMVFQSESTLYSVILCFDFSFYLSLHISVYI